MLAEVMTAFSGQAGEEPCEKAIPCGSARRLTLHPMVGG